MRVALARAVDFRGEVPLEGTPIVCIVVRDAKGLEQRLQLYKDFVRAPAKDVRQNLPGTVIDSMSQLALLLLLAHKTPHFVHFGFIHALQDDLNLARRQAVGSDPHTKMPCFVGCSDALLPLDRRRAGAVFLHDGCGR